VGQVSAGRFHRVGAYLADQLNRLVVGRAWQDDVAIDRPLQRTPVGGHGRTLPETADRQALATPILAMPATADLATAASGWAAG
jgi:hypothetical protein